jgi:hypothetical protein
MMGSLGDDGTDDTSVDTGALPLSPDDTSIENTISPLSPGLVTDETPASVSVTAQGPSLPETVGNTFALSQDGTYVNVQTGQQGFSYAQAQAVVASQAAGTAAMVTTSAAAPSTIPTLTDPTTGVTYTYSSSTGQFAASNGGTAQLSTAAQALQSAGLLVTSAGKLTAEGLALANSGQLVSPVTPAPSTGLSAQLSSMTAWLSNQTLFAGIPNAVVLFGGLAGVVLVGALVSAPRKKKRK